MKNKLKTFEECEREGICFECFQKKGTNYMCSDCARYRDSCEKAKQNQKNSKEINEKLT